MNVAPQWFRMVCLSQITAFTCGHSAIGIAADFVIRGNVVTIETTKPVVSGDVVVLHKSQHKGNGLTDESGSFVITVRGKDEQNLTVYALAVQKRRFIPALTHPFTMRADKQPYLISDLTLSPFDSSPEAIKELKSVGERVQQVAPESASARELTAWIADVERHQKPVEFKVLVPAYFYPNGSGLRDWNTLMQSGKGKVAIYAIVNPSNGSGLTVNADYAKIVPKAAASGVKLVGYVSTRYGMRPIEDVEAELKRWFQFYPAISGIFIDEMATNPEAIAYYARLQMSLLSISSKAEIFSNPGTAIPETFVSQGLARTFVIFENSARLLPEIALPEWMRDYPADKFGVLIYQDTDSKQIETRLDWARSHGIDWIYLTDRFEQDRVLNPWTGLPSYWKQMIDSAGKKNESVR